MILITTPTNLSASGTKMKNMKEIIPITVKNAIISVLVFSVDNYLLRGV